MKNMSHKLRDNLATILGYTTSICAAWAVIDLDALDFHNFKTYFKLFVIAMPAIGGTLSTLKSKDQPS